MKEFKGSKNWRCGNDDIGTEGLSVNNYEFISAEGGYHVDSTNRGFGIATYMCKEDKNLIIAAPDLLEALIAVRDGAKEDSPEMWAMIDAAIAKALGETK